MTTIRIGIGGWTYEPWRGVFYPEKWPHKRELEYASQAFSAIEINGTYYSGFKPAVFAGWAKVVPDDFVFTLKGSRFCTNRKILADGGESIQRFVSQGIVELGAKLGPILWQFMATKTFDADDFGAFLKLLPTVHEGVTLRHAVHVRNGSFHTPQFVDLCRAARVAIVYADSQDHPAIADISGEFVYARLENAVEQEPAGYSPAMLDHWARVIHAWEQGKSPQGPPYFADPAPQTKRDVFVFAINGAKVRAPAAARALIDRLC